MGLVKGLPLKVEKVSANLCDPILRCHMPVPKVGVKETWLIVFFLLNWLGFFFYTQPFWRGWEYWARGEGNSTLSEKLLIRI